MDEGRIITAPIITEKSMNEAGRGRFTFAVAKDATKTQVKKAVEQLFKVHVMSVQTLVGKGKRARTGKKRVEIALSHFKKACVKLAEGERIDLFDVQTETAKTK